jgi:hypothetical protein
MVGTIKISTLRTLADLAILTTLKGGNPYTGIELRDCGVLIRMVAGGRALQNILSWYDLSHSCAETIIIPETIARMLKEFHGKVQ